MDIRFVPPDLRRLEGLKGEAMCVPLFQDERPLRGAGGLVDWRLSGRLSRLLLDARLVGERGEKLLLPARPKLPFDKLFLFGLGKREGFDAEVFGATVRIVLETLEKARVRSSVWVLPGRAQGRIDAVEAMERFLPLVEHADADEITLVEEPGAQREMEPIVERAKRRARAFGS